MCRPLCPNLGSDVQFLVKVIFIDFRLEKYLLFKKKYVYNFFLHYLRHSDVTKWGTVFLHEPKSLYVIVLSTPKVIVFLMLAVLKWITKVYRNTKVKILFNMDFNFTLN